MTTVPRTIGLFSWRSTEQIEHPITKSLHTRPIGPVRYALDGAEITEAEYTKARQAERDAQTAQREAIKDSVRATRSRRS